MHVFRCAPARKYANVTHVLRVLYACARAFARGVNWNREPTCLPVVTDERMMKFLILMREKAPAAFM